MATFAYKPLPTPGGLLRPGQFYGRVSSRAKYSGLIFSEVAHTQGVAMPPHTHEAAFISMLLQGSYSERICSRSFSYGAFSAVFHPPGLKHIDHIGEHGALFFMIEIRTSWLKGLNREFSALDLSPAFCRGEAMWLANRLYFEFDQQNQLHIESLTAEMLACIAKARLIRETQKPVWLNMVLDYLHEQLHTPVTLQALAGEIGVHPVYLSRVFRAAFRQTLGEYLNSVRMEAARQHLAFSIKPLSEIAQICGFADQSHFTRTFRRIIGTTPGSFRCAMNQRIGRPMRVPEA